MTGNWIKLHRKMLDHRIMQEPSLLQLWVWLLLRANFTPGTFRGVPIGVGQMAVGSRSGADEIGTSKSNFHRGLQKLASEPYCLISLKSERTFTVVTICNWKTYQSNDKPTRDADGTQVGHERDADGTDLGRTRDALGTQTGPIEERREYQEGQEFQEAKEPAAAKPPRKVRPGPETIPIPPTLDDLDFHELWGEWVEFRREMKKPISARAAKMQLKQMADIGLARAMAAIRFSIANDYQGLIEPGRNGTGKQESNNQKSRDMFNDFIQEEQHEQA